MGNGVNHSDRLSKGHLFTRTIIQNIIKLVDSSELNLFAETF